jgi:hypothetical protein
MKILVSELPSKPEECIFYKKECSRVPYSGDLCVTYRCAIDGYSRDCKTCDKLKTV